MCEGRPTRGSGLDEYPRGLQGYTGTCFVFHLATLIKMRKTVTMGVSPVELIIATEIEDGPLSLATLPNKQAAP